MFMKTAITFLESITDTLKEGKKWNHIKWTIKTKKGRKRVEDKNTNKEEGQQIEKSNPTMSTVTLCVNGPNAPVLRQDRVDQKM